ncbi:MAG: hypothetical protein SFU98_21245 [Leptospiraceae bacterium]|nr:hypothetical protein [Leptospiraceae bacterium]
MGTNLDKTKKAIGVGGIDNKDRLDMFKKFQSAGGKVIKEVEDQQEGYSKSSKGKSSGSKDSGKSSSGGSYKYDNSKYSDTAKGDTRAVSGLSDSEMGNFMNRLFIKFKCWASHITPFSQSSLNPQFLSEINVELRGALMSLKIAGNEILGNPDFSAKIAKQLDKFSPQYIELIGRGSKLFDASEMNELVEDYNLRPDAPVPIRKIGRPLYSLFRKMYYMYPYQATYKKALLLAFDCLQRLENKPALIYNTKKKKVATDITIAFEKMFEKLYLAIIRNEQKNIPMISLYMENLLNIQDDERPNKRSAGEELNALSGGEAPKEEVQEEVVQEKAPEQPQSPELVMGMKLMMDSPIEGLRKKHDPKNELAEIPDADKCFLSYLYFKEFDYEYSVVMTTKRIGIQSTIVNGVKVDHKSKLLSVYELSRSCMDQFKIYVEQAKEYFKAKNNPGSNYIEHSKKLTGLEQKRGQQSRNTRAVIRDYIERANEQFQILLDDMKGERMIVTNPDEILSFDSVESRKKLNKKQINQCILDAYCYTLAFSNRLLEDKGDLYGGVIELTPEQMSMVYGKAVSEGTASAKLDDESPLSKA